VVLLLFLAALLAKESAVVLPGLLLLLDMVQGRVQLNRRDFVQYARAAGWLFAGFVGVLLAYLVLRYQVLGTLSGTDAAPGLPYLREGHRVLNALRAWPEFVRLLFIPLDLTVDYSPGVVLPVESITPMVALGALLVLLAVALAVATPFAPRAGLVAGWFLLSILPVSNFFFPIGVLIAERTLYLPSVAVCFLAGFAWEAARAARLQTQRLVAVAAVGIVVLFSVRTIQRNPDWDSTAAVSRALNRDHPESYRAQWLNAVAVWQTGRLDLADRYFELSHRLWSRDSQMLAEWGHLNIVRSKFDRAIELLERSRDMTPFVPRTHEYLAVAYLQTGRAQEALETALHASTMKGTNSVFNLRTMAAAYEELGDYASAAKLRERMLQLRGGDLWLNRALLARARARAGDHKGALEAVEAALRQAGSDPRSRATVQEVADGVRSGCYAAGNRPCDTLDEWQVRLVPAPRQR
jgi:Tfp pilus assembly protein PilF